MPFTVAGELVGSGFWSFAKLSQKWIESCRALLLKTENGARMRLDGPLSGIEIALTSVGSGAIVTYRVRGSIGASAILLSDRNDTAEMELAEMFVQSMNRTLPRDAAGSSEFGEILTTHLRPLFAVVTVPNAELSDVDNELIREHSLHLAAAFFQSWTGS